MFDLDPAARELARLVDGVSEDRLDHPTPCSDWTVADLLTHIHQFAQVFTANARKEPAEPPQELVDDWRAAIREQLDELVLAWSREAAWQGRVSAGGVEMAAGDNAVVSVEELTVHAWDLARATGQELHADDARLDVVDRFFTLFADESAEGEGPFGPEAPAPEGATRWERTVARTGRDPAWRPAVG